MKITKNDYIVILTGAGISAESGIKTFRDSDGLWENHRVEDVATPEGFAKDPRLVWQFYIERYLQSLKSEPNPGHYALVELEKNLGDRFFLITQNVDGLHSRAGSERLVEMHGSLNTCFCTKCKTKYFMKDLDLDYTAHSTPKTQLPTLSEIPTCPKCKSMLRPDIVWFGEMPYYMDEIYYAMEKATIFMTIGTSGNVYPAAGLITIARRNKAKTIGVNLDKPENSTFIDEFYQGKAGEILPNFVRQLTIDKK